MGKRERRGASNEMEGGRVQIEHPTPSRFSVFSPFLLGMSSDGVTALTTQVKMVTRAKVISGASSRHMEE